MSIDENEEKDLVENEFQKIKGDERKMNSGFARKVWIIPTNTLDRNVGHFDI